MKLTSIVLLLLAPILCCAQEELNDDRKILKRPEVNAAMSEPVYRKLSTIHDQMGEDQLDEALNRLRKLENQRLSKYEKALVQQTTGFIHAQQGNEAQAIRSFEQSLATKSLPAQAHQGMLYSLAGLYMAEGQYLKSIETAREWLRYEESPSPDSYMLIGSAFTELDRFDDALPYVLKAIEREPTKRYASASELADDLNRFLAGEPIRARPVSATERFGKWIRRHPLVAALSTALALLFVVSFALVTWNWRGAELARANAVDKEWQALEAAGAEKKARTKAAEQQQLAEQRLGGIAWTG